MKRKNKSKYYYPLMDNNKSIEETQLNNVKDKYKKAN